MILNPHGPAALIEKASGQRPVWATTEKETISDTGTKIFTYFARYLATEAVVEVSALTDPRVGWGIDIRADDRGGIRIRARQHN